ncbi:MAG: hypothetical protein QXV05_02325 [Candidatus Korarchaeum sp.]
MGPEIRQDTDGRVTHLVAGLGASGTLMGPGGTSRRGSPAFSWWLLNPSWGIGYRD